MADDVFCAIALVASSCFVISCFPSCLLAFVPSWLLQRHFTDQREMIRRLFQPGMITDHFAAL